MTAKNLIIFGNGIGMALDPNFFALEQALEFAWNRRYIGRKQRKLILSCLSDSGELIEASEKAPTSEAEMDALHRALVACDTLKQFQENSGQTHSWLTKEGGKFPMAVRAYLNAAAYYFLQKMRGDDRSNLPPKFADALVKFCEDNGANIATLNYDDLVYDCFLNSSLMDRRWRDEQERAYLFDSFKHTFVKDLYSGYVENGKKRGWYLHLHGSALYRDIDGEITKLSRNDVSAGKNTATTHLVLTHVNHKTSVIHASPLLRYYWEILEDILPTQETITLFGYGGADAHLNRLIRKHHSENSRIRVIEWNSEITSEQGAQSEWNERLGVDVVLIRLSNILEFTDWQTGLLA